MRICMVTEDAVPTFRRFSRVQHIAECLASYFDIHIVCVKSPLRTTLNGIHLHPVSIRWDQFNPKTRFIAQLKLAAKVRQVCRDYRIDLVHGWWMASFTGGKVARKPVVSAMPDFIEDLYESFGFPLASSIKPYIGFWQTFVAKNSDAVIVESDVAEDIWANRGVPRNKLYPIPHGVKTDLFRFASPNGIRERLGIPEDVILVTYHGDIGFDDGVDILIEAVRDLDVWCLCVGPLPKDYFNYLRSIANNRTIIPGWLPYQEMPKLVATSDICISPFRSTLYTNTVFPTKTMEAMAAGKATICSRLKAFSKAVKDGYDIKLVSSGDITELRLAIKELVEDENLRKTLGRNAQKTAIEKFDWSLRAREEAEVFKTVVSAK